MTTKPKPLSAREKRLADSIEKMRAAMLDMIESIESEYNETQTTKLWRKLLKKEIP